MGNSNGYDIIKLLEHIRTQCLSSTGKKTVDPQFRCFELSDSGLFVYLDNQNWKMIMTSEDISFPDNGIRDIRLYHDAKPEYPAFLSALFFKNDGGYTEISIETCIRIEYDKTTKVLGTASSKSKASRVLQSCGSGTPGDVDWWDAPGVCYDFESDKTLLSTLIDAINGESRHTPETKEKLIASFREFEKRLGKEASLRNLLSSSKGEFTDKPDFTATRVAQALEDIEKHAEKPMEPAIREEL